MRGDLSGTATDRNSTARNTSSSRLTRKQSSCPPAGGRHTRRPNQISLQDEQHHATARVQQLPTCRRSPYSPQKRQQQAQAQTEELPTCRRSPYSPSKSKSAMMTPPTPSRDPPGLSAALVGTEPPNTPLARSGPEQLRTCRRSPYSPSRSKSAMMTPRCASCAGQSPSGTAAHLQGTTSTRRLLGELNRIQRAPRAPASCPRAPPPTWEPAEGGMLGVRRAQGS